MSLLTRERRQGRKEGGTYIPELVSPVSSFCDDLVVLDKDAAYGYFVG